MTIATEETKLCMWCEDGNATHTATYIDDSGVIYEEITEQVCFRCFEHYELEERVKALTRRVRELESRRHD